VTISSELRPGLDRHVLPIRRASSPSDGWVSSGVVLDNDGFLELPRPDGLWFYGGPQPIPVTDLVSSECSFVLLAPGGVGKTTVLDELRRLEPPAIAVDLGLYDKSGMHQQIAAAIERGGPIYLDGLDVIASEVPAVFRIIGHYLSKPEAQRVRWRLACRPAVWDASLAASFEQSVPGFQELRLLPLTRAAAVALAARVGASEAFLDVAVGANLGRLAGSALRFEAAVKQWRDTRQLPESHLTAVHHEVEQMLTETNAAVRAVVPVDRRLRIAMRLASDRDLLVRYGDRRGADVPSPSVRRVPCRTVRDDPADHP
jgi:hypothetical protein